jgi:pimeloyl-ACP methyl ester carboxylesterase
LVDGALAIPFEVPVPVGVAIYPQELVKIPRAWAERNVNLIHWHEAEQGGHFAAMEQPATFVNDLRRFKQRAEAHL